MKFISEEIGEKPILEITKTKSGKTFIEGVFAQAETQNGNNRIYPLDVLKESVDEYESLWVGKNRAIGEIDHPQSPTPSPKAASHIIESLEFDGNNVIGRARVLESLPQGKILKGLLDEGISLGVSTRGLGKFHESKNGASIIDAFKLFAVDVVINPSAPDAFVNGVYEGKEWALDAFKNEDDLNNPEHKIILLDALFKTLRRG
jgi:hypothetical protein